MERKPAPSARTRLQPILPGDPRRSRAEAFITSVFLNAFDARLATHPEELLADIDPFGRWRAVTGIRRAVDGPLFSEIYLDAPIETLLSTRLGHDVRRESMIEVAQLAPERAGMARPMIAALTRELAARGYAWVIFTTVPRLRNAFHRMGLAPLELAPADPQRLPADERAAWGSYYQHTPRVYAGDIASGAHILTASADAANAA